ncbi:FXYD domain containing ion transport regulator 5 isoform X1 [Carcharodon carcharias]|uniref:FXYD domain containing ion transport regulator 5 isoform X1 n=1 Tax=Carcharodon carcharias TaxID=13397 RepID=UPI001B7E468E|nr:FXYD domain containing ion transport regulator 5 isoform X1 [Carcharodon carcharias]
MARRHVVWLGLTIVVLGRLSPGVDSGASTQGTNTSDEIPVTNIAPTIITTDTLHVNYSDEASSQSPTAVFTDTWNTSTRADEASSQSPTAVFTDTWNTSTPTDEASSQSPTAVFTDTWNTSTPTAVRSPDIPITRRPIGATTTTKDRITAKKGAKYTIPDNAERFEYDYRSLRMWGLVIAFILFTVGILVLFLDRLRIPRCSGCKTGRKHGKYSISTEA